MSTARRIALLVTALALCLSASLLPARAQNVSVSIDGRVLSFDQPPVMVGGRVLVPLRGIFEGLGADVLYNAAARSIKATRGGTVVELSLGSRQALVNGSAVYMDVPAQSMGGRTLVPLRFISEALGADVRWNAATQSVAITSPAGPVGGVTPSPGASPSPSPVAQAPQISGIVIDSERQLQAGDVLRVTMTGTPGAMATFDVSALQSGVPMHEVQAGVYRGELRITEAMQARRARIVGHLRANGLEDIEEAQQRISIVPPNAPVGGIPVGPGAGMGTISIAPGGPFYAGQTLTITATGVPGAYATMNIGPNQNIPMQQTAPGTYIGTYTLNAADTQPMPVSVTFRLPNGQVSTFTAPQPVGIGLGGTVGGYPYPGAGGPIFLNVTSPGPGQRIANDFVLTGNTVPYAVVNVQGTVQRPLIPGIIGIPSRQVSASGRADASGNFSIPVAVGSLPNGGTLTLQAQAIDPAGRTTQWQQFQFATGP